MTDQPNTFLGLLSNYKVEIPMIQRDYAQGRDDTKTKALREKFVKDLLNSLEDDGKDIELDFIYGPIVKGTFSPLDGQQRLTTLYLLHWYLAKKVDNKIDDTDILEKLKKFTYKVRISTQEFCTALLDPNKGGKISLSGSPKEEILDAAWYYSSWNYDPTVQGMLNMLDTIHAEYPNHPNVKLENLERITFNLMPMNEFGLGDELYMRMNARGIPLTPFENFKAWLQGYCNKVTKDENDASKYFSSDHEEKWTTKIDKEWTDLIWENSKEKQEDGKEEFSDTLFDNQFLHFFTGMAQLAVANKSCSNTWSEKLEPDKTNQQLWIEELSSGKDLPNSKYEEIECFDEKSLKDMFACLDFLCDKKFDMKVLQDWTFFEEENIFESFLNNQTYKNKVLFYAFVQFTKSNELDTEDKLEDFKDFRRVIRNLVGSSTIDTSATFIRAIEGVNELAEIAKGEFLKSFSPPSTGFDVKQGKEEALKVQLITANPVWKTPIIEAENHQLFKGRIHFLLKKIDGDKLDDMNTNDLGEFNNRVELSEEL